MSKRAFVMVGLASAIVAAVWASSGGAVAAAKKTTVVPVPNRFTTVPYRNISWPGTKAGPYAVAPDHAVITKTGAQSETSIAIDPTNVKHLLGVSNDLSSFSTFNNLWESFDRGKTWASAG